MRKLMFYVLTALLLCGCDLYSKISVTPDEMACLWKWDPDTLLKNSINVSDSGFYVGLCNDTINITYKLNFDVYHSVESTFGDGAYTVLGDTIYTTMYDRELKKMKAFRFRIIDSFNLECLDVETAGCPLRYVYFKFDRPILLDQNILKELPHLWETKTDYDKWVEKYTFKSIKNTVES